jgi:multiple sugar transport system permease protein
VRSPRAAGRGRAARFGAAGPKALAFGDLKRRGIVPVVAVYALLAAIGYVYLYPVLFMVSNSLKSLDDLLSPVVKWIPTGWYPDNFRRAAEVMGYWPVLGQTLVAAVLPAAAGTVAAAVAGYGFARFRFPLRGLWFALMLATFVLPPQVTMIPEFLMYRRLGLIGSVASFIVPALFGQGLRSAIFILIFFQFTRMLPKSMEEAAVVDGAGPVKIFLKIFVPMSGPAFLVSFLFGFVWYWNETYLASLYFQDTWKTLPLQLARFVASYELRYPPGANVRDRLNEGIKMAGTVLTILPVLVVYIVLQRWFVEGVDRTGITGE